MIDSWKILSYANPPRIVLKLNKQALEALATLRKNTKLKELNISDELLGKINSYSIGDNATSFAKICNDLDDVLNNALPNADKIKGLDELIGSAGFGNKSAYTRRHADLTLKTLKENANFIKNADEVSFEVKEMYDGIANAVSDVDFIKKGKRYVAEIKAGENVITDNFSTQCQNFMQRVDDLKNFKLFRREGVALSKQEVITNWKKGGLLGDEKIIDLFNKYKVVELGKAGEINKFKIEEFLLSNENWFNLIFNSKFN